MRPLLAPVALLAALLVSACGPSGTATPTPAPSEIITAADAAAAVAARSPLFDGIGTKDADAIGGSASWSATPSDSETPPASWRVSFEIGWGDCIAGCIDRHAWMYDVARDGTVTYQGDEGSAVVDDVILARLASAVGPGVGGRVSAGPTCPVERPGDPACVPRSVAGAVLVVQRNGAEVARFTTDASGLYRFALEPGDYVLEAQPVEGLMGTPGPLPFTVAGTQLTALDVPYDTGIR